MPALPLEVVWTSSALVLLVLAILYWFGRRARWTAAPLAARGHLTATAVLTLVATAVWAGPTPFAALWVTDGAGGWVRAGGGAPSGHWSRETLETAPVDAPLLAAAILLPALWLLVIPALGQVTWPPATGPRRSAALIARRWQSLVPPRLLLLVAPGAILALAGVAAAAATPGVQGAEYRQHLSEQATPFSARFAGMPAGSAVAPWYAAGAAAVLLALCAVLAICHRRRALSGLDPAQDLAARRIAVDHACRIGAALLAWIGLAGLAGALEAHERRQAAQEAAAAYSAWEAGRIPAAEMAGWLTPVANGAPAEMLLLLGSTVVGVLLVLVRPAREQRILRGAADGTRADGPAARGGACD